MLLFEARNTLPSITLLVEPISIKSHGRCSHFTPVGRLDDRHQQTKPFFARRKRGVSLHVSDQLLMQFLRFFGGKKFARPTRILAGQRKCTLCREALNLGETSDVTRCKGRHHFIFGAEVGRHFVCHALADTRDGGQDHAFHRLSRA